MSKIVSAIISLVLLAGCVDNSSAKDNASNYPIVVFTRIETLYCHDIADYVSVANDCVGNNTYYLVYNLALGDSWYKR